MLTLNNKKIMLENQEKWKRIIIHCSATKPSQKVTVKDIDAWHKARGMKEIGYHFVVDTEGRIHVGRAITSIGAHCFGYNRSSIGICYIGGLNEEGLPADTRTPKQKAALHHLVKQMMRAFSIQKVIGHNEVSDKACPCFNVQEEFA